MSNAVIYARYSSDKQSEDSIEAQLRACRQYAATKGYNIVAVYADEAISGKGSMTASRAQYQKMLRDCNKVSILFLFTNTIVWLDHWANTLILTLACRKWALH